MEDLTEKASLKSDLAFIQTHLSFLPGSIQQLEEAGVTLTDSLGIVEDAKNKIDSIPGPKEVFFKAKMDAVLEKNTALKFLLELLVFCKARRAQSCQEN